MGGDETMAVLLCFSLAPAFGSNSTAAVSWIHWATQIAWSRRRHRALVAITIRERSTSSVMEILAAHLPGVRVIGFHAPTQNQHHAPRPRVPVRVQIKSQPGRPHGRDLTRASSSPPVAVAAPHGGAGTSPFRQGAKNHKDSNTPRQR
nr:unnamed protein product [Digitaria exilis]